MAHNTYEGDMTRIRDEEFDSTNTKSGSENQEGGSGDEQDPLPKKKRYHRHTQHQIQEIEAFFIECLHLDDKQKKGLSRELGLEPLQIKFWFQNKRTQMKTQHERHENTQLINENEKLRADNMQYREALTIAARYVGKPVLNYPVISPPMPPRPVDLGVGNFGGQPGIGGEIYEAGDLLRSISAPIEADEPMIIELAVATMEELIRMAQMDKRLGMNNLDGIESVLNEDEYTRIFPHGLDPKLAGFKCEASRESDVVIMNNINLVEYLMDVNQWSTLFSGIVSRTLTLEVLSTGLHGTTMEPYK
ncbi:hypothetical protein OIU76_016284 [Salix suchowensis]|uniref:Uncharacterized protein n=1 Tax=Salix suchowensis TaxID=1278906 RepID=A0ABQ9AUK9_9ROSI|nr:hypothetical protein OIU77_004491 [Salix suchowensis]KAJ6379610.1 hypothetical protein OIU76_016284 [Salix suchowensis]